jgi:hypothetical protein
MRFWKASVAGLLTLAGIALSAHAQIPTAPPIPGAAASGVGTSAISSAAGAAQPKTLWSFFGITKANCAICKEKFCASNLGMMVNNMMGPVGAISGGMLGSCCPTVPTAKQLQDIANGPGGPNGAAAVAAKIKASEADAKARVAAVEYLGTVDCRRWPEASKALVAALRGDQNECVRYAAARVLNNGCCCTKETIAALKDTIASEPADKLPVETSDRVRAAAMVALSRCQFLNPETIEVEQERESAPPPPPTPAREGTAMNGTSDPGVTVAGANSLDPDVRLSAHIAKIRRKPAREILAEARRELEIARRSGPPATLTTGNRSLLDVLARSRRNGNEAQASVAPPVYAAPPIAVPPPAYPPTPAPAATYPPTNIEDPQVRSSGYQMPAGSPTPPRRSSGSLSEVFRRARTPGR